MLLRCCAWCPGAQQHHLQEEAGLRTWVDVVGNVHGRVEARHTLCHRLWKPPLLLTRILETQGSQPCPALMLGSHYDTVIDGGFYDGALGVIVAISALKAALLELAPGNALRCPVWCSPAHRLFDRGLRRLAPGGNRGFQ